MRTSLRTVSALMILGGFGASVSAAPVAIYTKNPLSPTSIVPGALDASGMPAVTNFLQIFQLVVSPDGSTWLLRASTQQGSTLDNIVLIGSGLSGTRFLQENEAMPGGPAGELVDFFGSGLGRFNDNNELAFSLRARGASTNQKVLAWDSVNGFSAVYQQGNNYTGLLDSSGAGNELVGNSVGSIHILNDGRIGAQDSTIQNIATAYRPAAFYDLAAFRQSNVSMVTGLGGSGTELVTSIGSNAFYTTTNGAHWGFIGDINRPSGSSNAIVIDDVVQMRQGQPVPGSTALFNDGVALGAYGDDIYVRGSTTSPTGVFAWRTNTLVAETGDIISGSEAWGTSFVSFSGNRNGDWILVGKTDASEEANDVIVLNGTQVIVREGDAVDVDGDGDTADDDTFIGRATNTQSAFSGDAFLTDDGWVYFMANIRNAAGMEYQGSPSLGSPLGFFRVRAFTPPPSCPADANGDNQVNSADLSVLLANFGNAASGPASGDFNNDGQCNVADLSILLANFGSSCV